MKLNIINDPNINELEIEVKYPKMDNDTINLINIIKSYNQQIEVIDNERIKFININEILYIESVDHKVFIYTLNKVYETKYRLYELLDNLKYQGFIRISKSVGVNILAIDNITPEYGRRLILELKNKEKLVVSRAYVANLKEILNIGGR